jgi:hypothetical protein
LSSHQDEINILKKQIAELQSALYCKKGSNGTVEQEVNEENGGGYMSAGSNTNNVDEVGDGNMSTVDTRKTYEEIRKQKNNELKSKKRIQNKEGIEKESQIEEVVNNVHDENKQMSRKDEYWETGERKSQYEISRDIRVARNKKHLEDLGLSTFLASSKKKEKLNKEKKNDFYSSSDSDEDGKTCNTVSAPPIVGKSLPDSSNQRGARNGKCLLDHDDSMVYKDEQLATYCGEDQLFWNVNCSSCGKRASQTKDTGCFVPNWKLPLRYCCNFETKGCKMVLCGPCFSKKIMEKTTTGRTQRRLRK